MSKMYEKSVGNNKKLLYDSNGKCIGHGYTNKNGRTIYSGPNGYVGKSYETSQGTVKYYDADNNYTGSGFKRSDMSSIVCDDNKSQTSQIAPSNANSSQSKPEGGGCALPMCCIIILGGILVLLKILGS